MDKSQDTQDRAATVLAAVTIILYGVHAVAAVASNRHLFGDTSWFLVRILSDGTVVRFYYGLEDLYYSRVAAYWLTQSPTVAALHLGVQTIDHLSWILGATYFIYKPLCIAVSYFLLPKGERMFVVFPALGIFAGTINSEIHIATESHLATSFFWPLLLALGHVQDFRRRATIITAISILVWSLIYETVAILAPILLIVVVIRMRRAGPGTRKGLLALGVLLALATMISWASVVWPRDPENRASFSGGIWKLVQDSGNGIAHLHIGPLVSVLAILLLGYILFRGRQPHPATRRLLLGGVAVLLFMIPPVHFVFTQRSLDFTNAITDRSFSSLAAQLLLVSLYLITRYYATPSLSRHSFAVSALTISLAGGQVAWQVLATKAWVEAVTVLRYAVASLEGPIACSSLSTRFSAASNVSIDHVLCGWWVMPLSLLEAPNRRVQCLISSSESFRPFDPLNESSLPSMSYLPVDYSRYISALGASSTIREGEAVSFRKGAQGVNFLRNGFSGPESWGTWTDGDRAQLRLCGLEEISGEQIRLVFVLRAYLPVQRPQLRTTILTGEQELETWTFVRGEAVVPRTLNVSKDRLSLDGCLSLTFRISDPRSPAESGESSDPRKLGLAFVKLSLNP